MLWLRESLGGRVWGKGAVESLGERFYKIDVGWEPLLKEWPAVDIVLPNELIKSAVGASRRYGYGATQRSWSNFRVSRY